MEVDLVGTIQAFVEDEYVDHYKEEIEKYFGEGSCHVLKSKKKFGWNEGTLR